MPFLPVVLLVAWQAISRSASFALGWATSLYFGQVPGRQGGVLSVISLLAAAWAVVALGFALPLALSAGLVGFGAIPRGFEVRPLHAVGLGAAVVLTPPAIAAAVTMGGFFEGRSILAWARRVPVSYPAAFMLGISVLQMVAVTPILLIQRWRQGRVLVHVPLVLREGSDGDLVAAAGRALRSIGIAKVAVREARGPKTWPMRTVGFAAEHLLGAVVRGEPMQLEADGVEMYAYATNVSILGPPDAVYRARAAVERELAFVDAYLTWDERAQRFERALRDAHAAADGDLGALRGELDRIQERIDRAEMNSEEWNVLYRIRLQLELRPSGSRR
jgi:hypothetical protein